MTASLRSEAPHAQAVLEVEHDATRRGRSGARGAAELADLVAGEPVHRLADQGPPAALGAARLAALTRHDALGEQGAVEVRLARDLRCGDDAHPELSLRQRGIASFLGAKNVQNAHSKANLTLTPEISSEASGRLGGGALRVGPMRESALMESLTTGTMAGKGSFRCSGCGYVLTLAHGDTIPPCPSCGGEQFSRASLFAAGVAASSLPGGEPAREEDVRGLLDEAADRMEEPGQYLVYRDGGRTQVVAIAREWTRIGRSLAADVRFDDPTVSRRHALIVRQADGVRVLDDRSLNGVFVNGERVEWRALAGGDEIVVGRYRLHFVETSGAGGPLAAHDAATPTLEAEA
jgi:predicted RNA-binding Zn-ribbon protein involved in translation (DUF1610 family)